MVAARRGFQYPPDCAPGNAAAAGELGARVPGITPPVYREHRVGLQPPGTAKAALCFAWPGDACDGQMGPSAQVGQHVNDGAAGQVLGQVGRSTDAVEPRRLNPQGQQAHAAGVQFGDGPSHVLNPGSEDPQSIHRDLVAGVEPGQTMAPAAGLPAPLRLGASAPR